MNKADDRAIERAVELERKARWAHVAIRQARADFDTLSGSPVFSDAIRGLTEFDNLEQLLEVADDMSRDVRDLSYEVMRAFD